MPVVFGISTPTLVKSEVEAPMLYLQTKSDEIASNFIQEQTNMRKRLNWPGLEPMTWNVEGVRGYQLNHKVLATAGACEAQ